MKNDTKVTKPRLFSTPSLRQTPEALEHLRQEKRQRLHLLCPWKLFST
jgi:hypothetical protein